MKSKPVISSSVHFDFFPFLMSSSVRNLCLRLLSGGLYSFLCIRGEERKATMFCTQSKSRVVMRFLGNSRRVRLVRVRDEVVDDFLKRLASMRNAVFDVFVHFCESVAGFVVGLETRIPSETCFSARHHDLSRTDSLNYGFRNHGEAPYLEELGFLKIVTHYGKRTHCLR